jgi:hypothetical protein
MSTSSTPDAGDDVADEARQPIQVGILTKGKPTLAMVLVALVLQDRQPLDITIVDTAETAVIKRDDVVFAMRLAFDRGIHCGYEHIRERSRAFSLGRLRLLDELTGPLVSFMDDDVVLDPTAIPNLQAWAAQARAFGFASPVCKNWGEADNPFPGRPHYSPGGLIYQDDVVRRILREYYATTTDVIDRRGSGERVWEKAFLSELFPALGRECQVRPDCLSYHLDYHERPVRFGVDDAIVQASAALARQMAGARAREPKER